jgi:glucose dehydrogenase
VTHTVAIVGSGISGIALAYMLTQRGHRVRLYERGFQLPDSAERYRLITNFAYPNDSAAFPRIDPNLHHVTQSGDRLFDRPIERELRPYIGGMALFWAGIAVRMFPNDFRLADVYGRSINAPISYDEIEPYYGRAEQFMGVSGTDDDNPFAPPRSTPFPLPPFELGYYDTIMAERLGAAGIHLHTTPQARARQAYEDRSGCQNTSICYSCPFDALYTPIYHLNKALATGLCTVEAEVTVRRILVDNDGRATGVLAQPNGGGDAQEIPADVVVVASGAIEAPRLLLLSANDRFRDGPGNASGHVGQHLSFHMIRRVSVAYDEPVYSGRTGFWTGQSMQFADHEARDQYGGVKLEASETRNFGPLGRVRAGYLALDAETLAERLRDASPLYRRTYAAHAESDTTAGKYVTLSTDEVDAFGDPIAHVQYDMSAFDERTFEFSQQILQRVADGTNGAIVENIEPAEWTTGHHHMGTARMAESEADGVVDQYGRVFGTQNVFMVGASRFSGTSAVNPTLTLLALALLTGDYLLDQALS